MRKYPSERLNKLHQQTMWRREVEIVERHWQNCDEEDRVSARSEIRDLLAHIEPALMLSSLDDLTKAELVDRIRDLNRRLA